MTTQRLAFKKGRLASGTTAYVILIVASIAMVGPLFYFVSTSIKKTTRCSPIRRIGSPGFHSGAITRFFSARRVSS